MKKAPLACSCHKPKPGEFLGGEGCTCSPRHIDYGIAQPGCPKHRPANCPVHSGNFTGTPTCSCQHGLKMLGCRVHDPNSKLGQTTKDGVMKVSVEFDAPPSIAAYPLERVSRFEVIDHRGKGRVVVEYGVNVELSYQDDGRTLKVFLTDREED